MDELAVMRAFSLLGVPLMLRLRAAEPRHQVQLDAAVDAAKAEAMANFRRRVKAAHPDAGGSEAETQALLAARDVVRRVRLRVPGPRPQPAVVVQVFRWQGNATTATTATTQTSVRF